MPISKICARKQADCIKSSLSSILSAMLVTVERNDSILTGKKLPAERLRLGALRVSEDRKETQTEGLEQEDEQRA